MAISYETEPLKCPDSKDLMQNKNFTGEEKEYIYLLFLMNNIGINDI